MQKRLLAAALVLILAVTCLTVPAGAARKLCRGSKGEDVKQLQTALKELGFYNGKADGVFGTATFRAVRAFQKKNGLKADGVAGPLTLAKLYEMTGGAAFEGDEEPDELKFGDTGNAVFRMKQKLWYLGYFSSEMNDQFDNETRLAVIAFQNAKKIKQSGFADRKTLDALTDAWNTARNAAGSLPDEAAHILNTMAVQSGAVCGTLVLSKNGNTFLTWSFGGADSNTCFRIASITKWVTAIGLMTLYDQEKLNLDEDISHYLPFKVRNPAWPNKAITARMLLSHTSSLSPDASDYHPKWARIGVNGYDPIFNENIEPGTQYAYADYNGALFGCLIEAITGESVQEYMNRTVFRPLGLTAAYTPKLLPAGTPTKDLLDPKGKAAITVRRDMNRAFNNRADPAGNNGYTVGKLYISTDSLTRLAQMMLQGGELNGVRILKEETVALMEADQQGLAASPYGLSTVRHRQFQGGIWYGHQGRYSGLTSNIYYQRETGITLALVMNGYDYQLQDNIVMPAVTLMNQMERIETLCLGGKEQAAE